MTAVHVVAGLLAIFMLVRHVPRARALLGGETGARPMAIVSALNVVLALAILGFAVRGLVAWLRSR